LAKQEAALLLAAAKAGDTQSLQDVLVHGVDWLGVMDEDGMNALHHAAAGGHQDTINSLLERDSSGSSLSARSNDGSSALHLASYYGFDAAVELLLARGADVHAVDVEGSTALHNAAYKGNSDIVSLLIKAGVNVNQQQVMHIVLAYMHAQIRMHAACIKSETRRACIQGGWGLLCVLILLYIYPHTTISVSSYYAHIHASIFTCINNIFLLHTQTKDALTALHLAAMSGATEAVSRLLAAGADKSLRSTDGKSAGDIAREHRQTRVQASRCPAIH
jgi:ankyrin repeat protein